MAIGNLGAHFYNLRQHAVQLFEHIIIRKPQNAIPIFNEPCVACTIMRRLRRLGVNIAIDFNDKFRGRMVEIHDEAIDRMLPADAQAIQLIMAQA